MDLTEKCTKNNPGKLPISGPVWTVEELCQPCRELRLVQGIDTNAICHFKVIVVIFGENGVPGAKAAMD